MWNRPYVESSLLEQAQADSDAIKRGSETIVLPDGKKVRVFINGAGETIIFVPMVTELNFVYAPQIEEFSRDYRVILHEPALSWQRHFGILDRANELVLLMDIIGIERAHFIAWSDAGSAAYILARDWPDRCLSLTLFGLADRYRFPFPLNIGTYFLSKFRIEHVVPTWLLALAIAKYLSGKIVNARWVREQASRIPNLPPLFKHSIIPNLVEHQPIAGEVHVPALMICGDADYLVTPIQARRMAKLLSNCESTVIIEDGEHFLPYVNANDVNESVRRFYHRLDCCGG